MLPIITIFADKHTSHAQVLGVLAHEVGHVLQEVGTERHWGVFSALPLMKDRLPGRRGVTGKRGKKFPSFDASVRSYLDASTYLPLYANYDLSLAYSGENCIEKRDILYTEWASFIDFLLTTYGTDQLEALFHSSPPEETEIDGERVVVWTPADFEGVYGSELNQLEAEWLSHLTAQ